MNLFTRVATLAPEHFQDGLAYAPDVAKYVSKKTGLEVNAWGSVYGAPVGTVSWSARVESQAAMGDAQDALATDPGFQKLVQENAHLFTGSMEDTIGQFVAMEGTGDEVPQYAAIVTAQCAPGRITEAMAWGVDIMHYASKLTGLDGALVRGIYGPFATLAWISLAGTLEQADAADAAMSTDPTYIERIDQGGELFIPGTASQRLIRRLA